MPLTPFSISAEGAKAKVVVAGEDVSDRVSALLLRMEFGHVPELTLLVHGEGTVEAEGVVRVDSSKGDAVEAVREMIAGMDPSELDRLAMDEITTQGASPGAAFKAALLRLLS